VIGRRIPGSILACVLLALAARPAGAQVGTGTVSGIVRDQAGGAVPGAAVTATDLRAGAALIVAALGAEGESTIDGVEHVDRGYGALVEKLQQAGADITRGDVDSEARLFSVNV
jgi:UDP-N-acetylglucosamine enolpyruvyl transferase